MTDWRSQRTQRFIGGIGCILLGTILGIVWGTIEIPLRYLPPLPPNPFVGLSVGILGVFSGFLVIRSAIGMKPTESRTQVELTTRQSNQVKVDVIQNGPFETEPYGSGRFEIGSRIELKAFPKENHPFKEWMCDTDSIEILNPYSATTVAIIKGPGTITANFL